jgi:hypothetical protein
MHFKFADLPYNWIVLLHVDAITKRAVAIDFQGTAHFLKEILISSTGLPLVIYIMTEEIFGNCRTSIYHFSHLKESLCQKLYF